MWENEREVFGNRTGITYGVGIRKYRPATLNQRDLLTPKPVSYHVGRATGMKPGIEN